MLLTESYKVCTVFPDAKSLKIYKGPFHTGFWNPSLMLLQPAWSLACLRGLLPSASKTHSPGVFPRPHFCVPTFLVNVFTPIFLQWAFQQSSGVEQKVITMWWSWSCWGLAWRISSIFAPASSAWRQSCCSLIRWWDFPTHVTYIESFFLPLIQSWKWAQCFMPPGYHWDIQYGLFTWIFYFLFIFIFLKRKRLPFFAFSWIMKLDNNFFLIGQSRGEMDCNVIPACLCHGKAQIVILLILIISVTV